MAELKTCKVQSRNWNLIGATETLHRRSWRSRRRYKPVRRGLYWRSRL